MISIPITEEAYAAGLRTCEPGELIAEYERDWHQRES
jgi:hypothetical protein